MAKVSIIVPVYNVEKYIRRCLESLLAQTLQDIEIIVINDGSTDESKEIIKQYLNDDKIKYFEKENGGLSSARNYGMKYATGEYIAFLDSDDYVEKNMYEEMYNLAKRQEADLVECDFVWEWESKKRDDEKSTVNKVRYDTRKYYKNKKEMMKKPRVVAWNKLIRRKIIEENNIKFPEGLIYEDLEFFYKIMPFINNISYINKYFVHYVQRNNSITNSQSEKNADIFKILDNIVKFYMDNNLYQKYEREIKYMQRRILLGSSMKRMIKIKNAVLRRKMFLKTIVFLTKNIKFEQKRNNLQKKETNSGKKNSHQMKICFGITKLGIGGAERVLVDIANELIKQYDITIFTIYAGGELEKELDKKINVISIYDVENKSRIIPIYILFCGKKIYNKYLRGKYDVDIAFLEGPITRIFSYKGNKKKFVWVHNDITKVFGNSVKARLKNVIDRYFYKKYDKIIFVSEQNKKAFEDIYGNISKREVIYNYIDKDRIMQNSFLPLPHGQCTFLTVSRLVKQKGIDRFIRVHKRLIDEGLFHNVYVIGDGEEKENLQKMCKKLKVEDTFIFLGKKENPYPYIKSANYFTLLSYYEGYGMVIEEAKILNKPIIITKTAAEEALRNYSRKIIIENDEESIYRELRKVLNGEYKFLKESTNEYNYDNKYLLKEIKKILN